MPHPDVGVGVESVLHLVAPTISDIWKPNHNAKALAPCRRLEENRALLWKKRPYQPISYDESIQPALSCQQPAVSPSPSTRNGIDEATQTSIVAEESDNPTTTSDIQPAPELSQHAELASLTGDVEEILARLFPFLKKRLNGKIQKRRLTNQKIRNTLDRMENCGKYLSILKTMEAELEAEKTETPELLDLLGQSERKSAASMDDWGRMVRENLETTTRVVPPDDRSRQ